MKTKRTFYKTTFTVEVLSEEPIPDHADLEEVLHEATEGGYSGDVVRQGSEELTGKQAAAALLAQGSDPEFFELTSTGEDA